MHDRSRNRRSGLPSPVRVHGRGADDYTGCMGDPNETSGREAGWQGDAPDEQGLVGRELEPASAEPEDEPLIGTIEDVENGSEVGWTE